MITLDVEIFRASEVGEGKRAPNRFLFHLYDDVFWTDDLDTGLEALRESINQVTGEYR